MSEEYLNKNDSIVDREAESTLMNEIGKHKFFRIMQQHNIDFDIVIQKKKAQNNDYHQFNFLIKKMREKNDLSLIDCAVYLYQDYFDMKKVLMCFNEDNMYHLRHELANKHGIKMYDTILKFFLTSTKK